MEHRSPRQSPLINQHFSCPTPPRIPTPASAKSPPLHPPRLHRVRRTRRPRCNDGRRSRRPAKMGRPTALPRPRRRRQFRAGPQLATATLIGSAFAVATASLLVILISNVNTTWLILASALIG